MNPSDYSVGHALGFTDPKFPEFKLLDLAAKVLMYCQLHYVLHLV